MPANTALDLYEVLELSRTATEQEIKESYKRLALLHHPDKNPNDAGATQRFQRISLAYETLRDASSRSRYDSRSARPAFPFPNSSPSSSSGRRSSHWSDDDSDDDSVFGSEFLRRQFYDLGLDLEELRKKLAAQRAQMEEERRRFQNEFQAREDLAKEQSQAKARAKKAEEEKKQKAKEMREKEERHLQEKHWSDLNVTNEADKQSTCRHSEFWPKEQQKKKFKCGSCRQKRSMLGYRCPHCSLLVCPQCLNNDAKRTVK